MQAGPQRVRSCFDALHCIFTRVCARYGNELSHPHGGAEERYIHQRFLQEDTCHPRYRRQQHGGVKIRLVIAHEDALLADWNIFQSNNADPNARGADTQPDGCPCPSGTWVENLFEEQTT